MCVAGRPRCCFLVIGMVAAVAVVLCVAVAVAANTSGVLVLQGES